MASDEKDGKDEAKLTAKEEKFCYEYVLHLNATKAAILAGYSEKTARNIGSQNLAKLNIQKKIKSLQDNLSETLEISKARVVREHEKIAFSSIAHLHNTWLERAEFEKLTDDQKACIRSISTKITKRNNGTYNEPDIVDVEYVKIELYDKQKSLDSIKAMLGFDAPVKTEMTGKDGKDLFPQKNIEEKKAELEELLKQIHG